MSPLRRLLAFLVRLVDLRNPPPDPEEIATANLCVGILIGCAIGGMAMWFAFRIYAPDPVLIGCKCPSLEEK